MARFGFVGPSYRSQSVNADCQLLMNLYVESVESGQGKGPLALYSTPGLALLYNLGQAGIRGLITAQGRTFAVAGTVLWELLAPTANPNKINRGTVVSDGQPVSMASGPTQVLIASGGNLYCFQLAAGTTLNATGVALPANSLTLLPGFNAATGFGLLGAVAQVTYADGFFFALIANSNQIQSSNPVDGSSWQGVSETQVSVFSDNVSAIYADHRLLWVFGPKNTQPYFDSGNFPFPYDVVQGGFIEQGIAAPFSVAKLDNSIFWLGQDERGNGIVWRANGYQPQRISTHAIEFEFGTYATIADAVCYAYQDQGHTFYVMNFPTAQKTWVYDCATQMWHQRGFWNTQAGVFTQSRAGFHTFAFGIHLVGDPTTGAVYQQSITIASDFGNPIRRIRRAPHISNEQSWIYHLKLQLDVETGLGPTLPGSAPPTIIPMLDTAGNLRSFQVGENGILEAPLNPTGNPATATTLFLNDEANTTSWKITINAQGVISPVLQAAYVSTYPVAVPFVSVLGDQNWTLELENLGGGIAIPQLIPQGIVGRGPEVNLRWSNDGGHTWSNLYARDCGQAGAYTTRVIWNRLGRARDRVYEISMTDPAPWRIIDAYLFTDPEDKAPTSRYASEARKRA
ncbi:MAG TPA: hypothetical protein VFF58_00670 [Candidatus Nitrosotalea sp.]|nr:hypothetical protein [Candidatus Nitrosotalea sp.]